MVNFGRMAKTRKLIGTDFDIISGNDDKTYDITTTQHILARLIFGLSKVVSLRGAQGFTEGFV